MSCLAGGFVLRLKRGLIANEDTYCAGERQQLIQDLHQTVAKVFVQWEQLNDLFITCRARRHKEMVGSLLCWQARMVYFYHIEAAMIYCGKNPY